jgi:subtilisin family serine protease
VKKIITSPVGVSMSLVLAMTLMTGCGGNKATISPDTSTQRLAVAIPVDPDPNFIPADEPIAGVYLVTLKESVMANAPASTTPSDSFAAKTEPIAASLITQYGGQLDQCFSDGIGGFIIKNMTNAQAIAMSHDSRIEAVEQDGIIRGNSGSSLQTTAPTLDTTLTRSTSLVTPSVGTNNITRQASSTQYSWALDRINRRYGRTQSSGTYTFRRTKTGQGVHVYVLDSGIRTDHAEFDGGRASIDANFVSGKTSADLFGGGQDGTDHGTAVASLIGGKNLGVANKAFLHSVKVLVTRNNSVSAGFDYLFGKTSTIKGMDWVTRHHRSTYGDAPAVVNLSVGMYTSSWLVKKMNFPSMASAMKNVLKNRIIFVCSAGNEWGHTGNASPADRFEAIVVGGIAREDNINSNVDPIYFLSNYGDRVDLFAPATNVLVATTSTTSSTSYESGTSFAAPLVTGVVAQYLEINPLANQQNVEDFLKSDAGSTSGNINFDTSKKGGTTAADGTTNRILFANL